ncbi:MAG: LysE family translocator [Bdellovibrionota bacterium]
MPQLTFLAVVCFVAMLSPGPDFVLVARSSLTQPRKQALATALGILSGCVVHATYCVLGLALVITKSVLLFSTIKLAGACYLIYLGIKSFLGAGKSSSTVELDGIVPIGCVSAKQAYVQGLLCNLLNPKLAVFLLSLFTQFLSPGATTSEKMLVAAVFVGEAALYWPLLVVTLQRPRAGQFFENIRAPIDRICGAMLVALGLRIALERR